MRTQTEMFEKEPNANESHLSEFTNHSTHFFPGGYHSNHELTPQCMLSRRTKKKTHAFFMYWNVCALYAESQRHRSSQYALHYHIEMKQAAE